MPKGTLTARLIAGYGLKLEKWFDDNEPYVELSPSNFNAQNPVWRSGVATPPRIAGSAARLGSDWQRGSNPLWDSERQKTTFHVGDGAEAGAKIRLVCWDRNPDGEDKCIGEAEIDLRLLLSQPAGGDLRAKHPIYGRGRHSPHGTIELMITYAPEGVSRATPRPCFLRLPA